MAKLVLTVDSRSERELTERANRMRPRSRGPTLSSLERSILFLRGIKARTTMVLPAFYLFYASTPSSGRAASIGGYPGIVFQHSINFSSLGTIALTCRQAFDQTVKDSTLLNGVKFAQTPDAILQKHAAYWADSSNRPLDDAYAALRLLQSIFHECSKTDTDLLKSTTPLGQRVGLLKQYAIRAGAHLSMQNYEVSLSECVHVVAALTLIAEIVRSFDDPASHETYFDELDQAAFTAAQTLFPTTPDLRLFQHMQVAMQARLCWQCVGNGELSADGKCFSNNCRMQSAGTDLQIA
jgi:hypothetical protein